MQKYDNKTDKHSPTRLLSLLLWSSRSTNSSSAEQSDERDQSDRARLPTKVDDPDRDRGHRNMMPQLSSVRKSLTKVTEVTEVTEVMEATESIEVTNRVYKLR